MILEEDEVEQCQEAGSDCLLIWPRKRQTRKGIDTSSARGKEERSLLIRHK